MTFDELNNAIVENNYADLDQYFSQTVSGWLHPDVNLPLYVNDDNLNTELSCLLAAVYADNVSAAELFLRMGANVNRPVIFGEHTSRFSQAAVDHDTPLHIAARRGNQDMVALLLRFGAGEYRNNNGQTPLHIAAAHQDNEIMTMFANAGFDFFVSDHAGSKPSDYSYLADLNVCTFFYPRNITILKRQLLSTVHAHSDQEEAQLTARVIPYIRSCYVTSAINDTLLMLYTYGMEADSNNQFAFQPVKAQCVTVNYLCVTRDIFDFANIGLQSSILQMNAQAMQAMLRKGAALDDVLVEFIDKSQRLKDAAIAHLRQQREAMQEKLDELQHHHQPVVATFKRRRYL